jgi:hypothetical protein
VNKVQIGCSRDNAIVDMVEKCRALDANQIAALLFRELPTGKRKAQQRLQKLHETKRLKRIRYSCNEPYVYYIDRLSGRLEHLVAVNWLYVWAKVSKRSWERLQAFEREPDYGTLQADALIAFRNTRDESANRFYFVEVDLSDNDWDKTVKYNQMFSAKGYKGQWWTAMTKKFPTILCIATDQARARVMQKSIAEENPNGLRFEVKMLDDIKKEVWPWKV